MNLWNSMKEGQLRASRTFVAALAVNQKHPEVALEIMKGEAMYNAMRHINLMAFAQTGQVNEIISMLKQMLEHFKENRNVNIKTSSEVVSLFA